MVVFNRLCVSQISSVSKSILGMPTFREPCSPLHQGEKQPDIELFSPGRSFYITLLVGVVKRKKIIVGGAGGGKGNWSAFNNRENGFPYFIYVVAVISI